jgi:heptaprenylglyceryl phosphate synthase
VVIGDALNLQIDVSQEAAYHDGSNVVAAFSLDQTVIRAIIETDMVMRHDAAVTVLSGVKWIP